MTTEEFIRDLCAAAGEDTEGVFLRGRREGWLEAEDELFATRSIARKNIARILHMYLLKVKKKPDLKNIDPAHELKDLYDCRICANHVAQIYCRGIMHARNLMRDGQFLWFDLEGESDDNEASEFIRRTLEI